jgi:hypothetical protein
MRLVERYSFVDRNHINYEETIEDPKVFSRPRKIRMPVYRRLEPNVQILDYECYSCAQGKIGGGSKKGHALDHRAVVLTEMILVARQEVLRPGIDGRKQNRNVLRR